MATEITLEKANLGDASPGFAMKIQTERAELNVWFKANELRKLSALKQAQWETRTSIQAGTAAGASVFWSSDRDGVSVLVGNDDEAWDFGVFLPAEIVETIVSMAMAQSCVPGDDLQQASPASGCKLI